MLKTLTFREREIIKLRYGIGDGYTYTLEEVGRIFKVTRERVRQIEAKAVRKLQHPVRAGSSKASSTESGADTPQPPAPKKGRRFFLALPLASCACRSLGGTTHGSAER